MRVVARPGRIEAGGKGYRIFDADAEIADAATTARVRHTLEFVLSDEPAQRMLLAVAAFADECGIASGWDETAGTAKGVSVTELALKAGLRLPHASDVLDRLCRDEYLYRLQTKPPSRGLVWVLPDYEDDAMRGIA